MVYVQAQDTAAHDAFVSLSFGRALVAAIRGVDPVPASAAPADLHEASVEDISIVMALGEELLEHHARAPIFWPHIAEPYAALEAHQRAHFEDPKTAHIVAYQGGKAVGLNSFVPPEWIDRVLRPDRTVYLYQGIVSGDARGGGAGKAILARGVEWAREQGYEHVALHYASPNISGARFWQSQGFEPIEYRLTRHIDERIAWAGG
jgi:ribosomal protein S18 acetylase RimI-like enzyme